MLVVMYARTQVAIACQQCANLAKATGDGTYSVETVALACDSKVVGDHSINYCGVIIDLVPNGPVIEGLARWEPECKIEQFYFQRGNTNVQTVQDDEEILHKNVLEH